MISALDIMTAEITGFDVPIDGGKMLEWQLAKIREAMRRAAEINSFYAERFRALEIADITSLRALRAVPFTTPADIIDNPGALVCEPMKNISRITSLRSSGSTAAPKRLCFTERDLARTARLFELGMAPIIGEKGRRCLIMMSDATPGSIASLLKKGVEKSGTPAVIYGNISNIDEAAMAVCEGDTIVGIPAQIIHLCRKYPRLRPESVLLSADYIPAPAASVIRELWQCRVYTHYGMTETCFGCAVQCSEESAQHIRHDSLLIEIVDPLSGEQLGFDREGEVVVTAFANEAMPLFRYRTGDISSLIAGRCKCGSILPRLGAVKGRLKNRITAGGGVFSIEALDDVLYKSPGLWQYEAEMRGGGERPELLINVRGDEKLRFSDLHGELAAMLPPALAIKIAMDDSPSQPFRKRRITVG
ncbi:DVU_1553 family AMP-dependent CoA ligase [Cloacibacillus evryensis]|uniref:DVU_1553 family AMP-dependent CoA ligase n=1 Tax=Cloacibacillus evryensis TaxID=508460 RepID=UPI00267106B9|nr:AMP-binding protein [Cloacibacillus evryensis]